jgi:hypothetical protein
MGPGWLPRIARQAVSALCSNGASGNSPESECFSRTMKMRRAFWSQAYQGIRRISDARSPRQ